MKKKYGILALALTAALTLSACGGKEEPEAANQKVQTITVGTGTQFPNVCFLDGNGKLTGYDVELVKEIDKRLPGYKFKFKTMDFSNLLVSLGAGKVDIVAHQMEKSKEREKKFLFNDVAYNNFPLQLTVLDSNNSINSTKDLAGKRVITSATSNGALVLKKINEEQGNNFEIAYEGQGSNDTANQLKTGRADATISTPFAVDFQNKTSAIKEKVVGDVLSNAKVYFMLGKDETKLSKDVDEALQSIIDDGTLKKLSEKWLGADYSKEQY
ncbi:amino acid ABC transporter substrate-binding protein [Listeria monocytogenes]|uniref:amino acid ABC transporter substrate-binding protein n=1 Tax=Listeria monocytogenes TaxID=1639 RepID=UPI000E72B3B8|nr:amino acid ABC transporter substrate-binding protein [Listeria monocytogenes]EBB5847365.1 amino acid ABC transporter substrate-binding protein [Listeria monocytogenes]PSA44272.1 amino acid ABC transporter substrate-binding protein [Listeria monocytogenes]